MNAQDLLRLSQGFMESRILHAAAELDLFTLLSGEPLTAPEIAERTEGNPRALAILLDAVAAMGLLVKRDEAYHCEGPVSRLLSADSPDSVRPMVLHMAHLWSRWSRLVDIAKGAPDMAPGFDLDRDEEELRAFIGAMHAIGAPLARQIVASTHPGASRNLLDIGGGSGTYTIAFLHAVPGMKATIFDLPEVVEMARERLTSENLIDRATLVAGNYYTDEFPGGHDLVLLSAIIHSNSLEENVELYRKSFRALTPGGRILIRDHVMDSTRTRPRDGAIFAINMLVGTSGGSTYTYHEIEQGLLDAGFHRIDLVRQGEHMDAVIEAYKP